MNSAVTTPIEISTAQEVHEQLDRAGVRLDIQPDTARLVVSTLRRLAGGRPVSIAEVEELAKGLQGADEAIDFIKQMTEKDDDGNVVGLMGLSLNEHPHDFEVNGQDVHTWCAWDTLFLPPLLAQTAHISSNDPATGREVRLRISPDGVEKAQPEEILVSIVIPETDIDSDGDAEEIQAIFCNFVHFFTSADAAAEWFSERDMPVKFLALDEAVKLGRLHLADLMVHV
jgi:alkylmercury lyase